MQVARLIAVATFALVSAQIAAQERTDAESVLLEYFEITKVYDTSALARLIHPEALSRFRRTIDLALEGPNSALAEAELLPLFDVTTVEEYRRLSDVDAYQRLNDVVARSAPELIEVMANASFEVVGEMNRDGIVYITYVVTMSMQGREVSTEVVQKLKQHQGMWLLLLPSTANATIAGIEAKYH